MDIGYIINAKHGYLVFFQAIAELKLEYNVIEETGFNGNLYRAFKKTD
jgi:hypothetical protein